MSTWARIVDGVAVEVGVQDDPPILHDGSPDEAWVKVKDGVGVDWTTPDGGKTWQEPVPPAAPVVVVPPDVQVPPVDQATDGVNAILAAQPALTAQSQADMELWATTKVGSTLSADHLAALGRMVGGFGTVMQAITDHMVLTGTIPTEDVPVPPSAPTGRKGQR